MFKIERNASKLNTLIIQAVKGFIKSNEVGHMALISALTHAAEHGQPAPLNNLIAGLTEHKLVNVVQNIKGYVNRLQTLTDDEGEPVLSATGKLQPSDIVFLEFKKGQFSVINGKQEERDRFVALADKELINPTNLAKYAPFYQRDILKEVKEFTDKNVLAQLSAMVKKIHGEADMVDSLVSRKIAVLIETVTSEVEKIVGTGQEEPKRVAAPAPKATTAKAKSPAGVAAPATH